MADIRREGDTLVVTLTVAEKIEGVHGDLRASVAAVADVQILDDALRAVRGIKIAGSHVPGLFAMGTFRTGSETLFAMVHRDTRRGIRLAFTEGTYHAWILGLADPEGTIQRLGLNGVRHGNASPP